MSTGISVVREVQRGRARAAHPTKSTLLGSLLGPGGMLLHAMNVTGTFVIQARYQFTIALAFRSSKQPCRLSAQGLATAPGRQCVKTTDWYNF